MQSKRGQNLLLYLMCVVAAFVFWLFLSLDGDIQKSYDVPVEIIDVPDSIHILDEVPSTISVSLHGKGFSFVKYKWGKLSPMKIPFADFSSANGRYRISKTGIESYVHTYFGQNIILQSLRPDSISFRATSLPGRMVKVVADANVTASPKCALTGDIVVVPDSVMIYSKHRFAADFHVVYTEPISEINLTDTLRIKNVKLKVSNGDRSIPSSVNVVIPVEPLIAKKKKLAVQVLNVPDGYRMLLFPYSVEVSYLVPMSKYNVDMALVAYVDYNSTTSANNLQITVSSGNPYCQNISYSPQSVDYVIERISDPK